MASAPMLRSIGIAIAMTVVLLQAAGYAQSPMVGMPDPLPVPPSSSPVTASPEQLLQQAREVRNGGDRRGAIALYETLLAIAPDFLDARLDYAQILSWDGRNSESIALYEAILLDNPSNYAALLGRAQVTSWLGQHQTAIEEYQQLLQQYPDDLAAQLGIAQVISWQGKHDAAIDEYQQILKTRPDALQAQLGIAQVLSWQGNHRQSLEAYQTILNAHPDTVEALSGQAQVTYWSGQTVVAIERYQAALSRYPDHPDLRLGLAQIYADQERVRPALELLTPLLEQHSPQAEALAQSLQATRLSTDFSSSSDNFGQAQQLIQQTARFRIDNSNTTQFIQLGNRSFEQANFSGLTNQRVQVGIEGKLGESSRFRAAAGVDLFNRLQAVPNVELEVSSEVLPKVYLSGTVQQGAYRANIDTLENRISALQLGPSLYWQIDKNTGLYTFYRWGNYNDGNEEQQFLLTLDRKFGDFFATGRLFTWSYGNSTQNGYFTPADFLVYGLDVGWQGNLSENLRCRLLFGLGSQRLAGEFTPANNYQVGCTLKAFDTLEADLGYSYSTVIEQTPGSRGYEYQSVYGQLRFLF